MAVADGTVLRIVGQLLFPDDVIAQNVFNLVFADTGGSNDDEDVISDCVDWLEGMFGNITALIDEDVDTDEIFVYFYDFVDDDWDELGASTWDVTFSAAAGMLPHGVAAVILGRTIDPDVSGKKYIGGMQETFVDDSTLGTSMINAMALLAADWITPFVGSATGADFAPVVWSPTRTNAYLLRSASVNAIAGYQRRRKPGVGI